MVVEIITKTTLSECYSFGVLPLHHWHEVGGEAGNVALEDDVIAKDNLSNAHIHSVGGHGNWNGTIITSLPSR